VGDNGEIDRWEEISSEATSLALSDSRQSLSHKVMHKVLLCWPQKTARMVFVKLVSSLEGVVVGGYEWWWVEIEYW
jgi:hypothetical protein